MEIFGGRKADKAAEAKRIKEVQELIRTFAGDVDENKVEMAQINEMMKAKKVEPPVEEKRPDAVPKDAKAESPVFCNQCGRRLPTDGTPCECAKEKKPVTIIVGQVLVPGQPRSEEPVIVKDSFCIRCGARLPDDGSGCQRCRYVKGTAPVRTEAPVQKRGGPVDRSNYCIRCGAKLPSDGSLCGCIKGPARNCPSCGAWVMASDVSCPVCSRALKR